MKKPIKIVLILLVSSICLLVSISIYNKTKVKNIFDEIYYAGAGATNEPFEKPRSVLENIPNIESKVYYLSSISENGEKITEESYQEKKLSDGMTNLSMTFYSKKRELNINVSYNITSTVNLSIDNTYNVSQKILVQTVSFFDKERKESVFVDDKEEVKNYLTTYHISEKQINEWNNRGLNHIFLKDWVAVYPSRFSPDKLGEVEIKTER